MRPKDQLSRQETSGDANRIWRSRRQRNYVGKTGRLLRTRIAVHAAAVRRHDTNSQVADQLTRTGHKFKLEEAEIRVRGVNRVSRELLESWFTGPQSINKCNDLPNPYLVLRLRLARAIDHSGSAQANTSANAGASEPAGRAIIPPPSNMGDEISAHNHVNANH
ncbi:unnamed protein product [Schistocephalus solidus]|uniref:Uncharacterized protein n=1 Tax=Schistocephalus solidus TaxID=70667 RepID=A0A183T413_SCHSO|nr:unnamed protein product [Schistocephalus solidus]